MLTPDDLRNPTLKSGYHCVRALLTQPWHAAKPYQAQARAADPDTTKRWFGPARATAREAAQDYCDHVNGREIADQRRERVRAVIEGGQQRRTITARIRRSNPLIAERRRKTGDVCEACGEGPPVAPRQRAWTQGHHSLPIAEGERTTTVDDLRVLCPNCHWVADTLGI